MTEGIEMQMTHFSPSNDTESNVETEYAELIDRAMQHPGIADMMEVFNVWQEAENRRSVAEEIKVSCVQSVAISTSE